VTLNTIFSVVNNTINGRFWLVSRLQPKDHPHDKINKLQTHGDFGFNRPPHLGDSGRGLTQRGGRLALTLEHKDKQKNNSGLRSPWDSLFRWSPMDGWALSRAVWESTSPRIKSWHAFGGSRARWVGGKYLNLYLI